LFLLRLHAAIDMFMQQNAAILLAKLKPTHSARAFAGMKGWGFVEYGGQDSILYGGGF
jgi:hypothetical protein